MNVHIMVERWKVSAIIITYEIQSYRDLFVELSIRSVWPHMNEDVLTTLDGFSFPCSSRLQGQLLIHQ
jgi:hypothetical protein